MIILSLKKEPETLRNGIMLFVHEHILVNVDTEIQNQVIY